HVQDSDQGYAALLSWPAPESACDDVRHLVSLFQQLADPAREIPVAAQIERIRQFYAPLLEERYDNPEVRLRDLDQLELLAHQATSRTSFLADLTLDPPRSTGDLAGSPLLDEEYVVLSTIHSAKGCEWDV